MQMSEPGLSCIYCVPPCVPTQIYEHFLRKPDKMMEVILRQTNIPSKLLQATGTMLLKTLDMWAVYGV